MTDSALLATPRPNLPTGVVTFVFTDIAGSTRLWERAAPAMAQAMERHDAIVRGAILDAGGAIFQTAGDAFSSAFADPQAALGAALAAARALQAEPWPAPPTGVGPLRVRFALHSGPAEVRYREYYGPLTLNRLARLLGVAHGGQVLVSAATAALLAGALPDGVSLRDLGVRRLRDLQVPEHIYQVVAPGIGADFPPLPTLDTRPHNLPAVTTALVDRIEDTARAGALLRRPDVRLLTFTGPGGTGKTRLALHVAGTALDEFEQGITFVALAAVQHPDLVLSAVARALGVREARTAPLATTLAAHLRDRRLLLVLDNFEQVADAAPQVSALLEAAPGLKVLVTSRVALNIYGERLFPVLPLAVPLLGGDHSLSTLAMVPAVQLFGERSAAANPAYMLTAENAATIAQICARLDGLPLALELAAAQGANWSPHDLLVQLDHRLAVLVDGPRDHPARQRTLRAAIAWSYDLLLPDEQALFRRLAVFAGGATPALIGAVIEAAAANNPYRDIAPPPDLQALLDTLVGHSLLESAPDPDGTRRYGMLETIREYGLEQLAATQEEHPLALALAHTLTTWAEGHEPALTGPEGPTTLALFEAEHANLRAALAWATAAGEATLALRLGGALWRFWHLRGYFYEGRAALERVLARPSAEVPPLVRAKALYGAGVLAWNQGDYAAARHLLDESLALHQDEGDLFGVAQTLNDLGVVAFEQGNYARAQAHYAESLALRREIGDQRGMAVSLNNLGTLAAEQGDYVTAQSLLTESLALRRALDDRRGSALLLINLGNMAAEQGDYATAQPLLEECLIVFRSLGDKRPTAYALNNLARVMAAQGAGDQGLALGRECLLLLRELGDRRLVAECLETVAQVLAEQNALVQATQLWASAAALRVATETSVPPDHRAQHEAALAQTRSQLGESAWSTAWAAGTALSVEDAITLAIDTG